MRAWMAWLGGVAMGAGLAALPEADPLALLEPLTALEWVAGFPNGKLTDTQRFEWMYGRKFLRNPHQVKDLSGKVVYEGENHAGKQQTAKVRSTSLLDGDWKPERELRFAPKQ